MIVSKNNYKNKRINKFQLLVVYKTASKIAPSITNAAAA